MKEERYIFICWFFLEMNRISYIEKRRMKKSYKVDSNNEYKKTTSTSLSWMNGYINTYVSWMNSYIIGLMTHE